MSYATIPKIAADGPLFDRVLGAAVTEQVYQAEAWVGQRRNAFAAQPGWSEAWESALAAHPADPDDPTSGPDPDYDPGSDEAVITDAMILSAVQSMSVPGRIGL